MRLRGRSETHGWARYALLMRHADQALGLRALTRDESDGKGTLHRAVRLESRRGGRGESCGRWDG